MMRSWRSARMQTREQMLVVRRDPVGVPRIYVGQAARVARQHQEPWDGESGMWRVARARVQMIRLASRQVVISRATAAALRMKAERKCCRKIRRKLRREMLGGKPYVVLALGLGL